MFSVATRIGTSYLKLKTHVVRDWFITSFKTLKGKFENATTSVGVGTTVTTVRNASGTIYNQNNRIETRKDVINFKELVRNRAISAYQKATNENDVDDIELDWSGVKLIYTETVYEPKNVTGNDPSQGEIFSRTVINNTSDVEQQHTLRQEGESFSCCTISIAKGFTSECSIDLSLQPSADFNIAKFGFSGGLSIKKETTIEYANQKKEAWFSENCIRIPKQSRVSLSTHTKQAQHDYNFTTWIGVDGTVIATVHNKTQNKTYQYRIPTKTIIVEEFSESMKKKVEGIYYIKFEGNCKFEYVTEQNIDINCHIV